MFGVLPPFSSHRVIDEPLGAVSVTPSCAGLWCHHETDTLTSVPAGSTDCVTLDLRPYNGPVNNAG